MSEGYKVCIHTAGFRDVSLETALRKKKIEFFRTQTLSASEKGSGSEETGDDVRIIRSCLAEGETLKFVIPLLDPVALNLMILLRNWERYVMGIKPVKASGALFRETLLKSISPDFCDQWWEREVHGCLGGGLELFDTSKRPWVIGNGAISLMVMRDDWDKRIKSQVLSSFLGEKIKVRDIDLKRGKTKTVERVLREDLPPDYVSDILRQDYVLQFFTPFEIQDIRKKWINREDFKVQGSVSRRLTLAEFGREMPFQFKPDDGLRVFEMQGGFEHHGERTNMAMSRFWAARASHFGDIRNHLELEDNRQKNYKAWVKRDHSGISDIGGFSPVIDVAIRDVEIEVQGIPIEKYPFMLGDGCVYVDESSHWDENGSERKLPCPSEVHCTAIALWNSSNFLRSLELPDDLPLFLSRRETLLTPSHFSRHWPHEIDSEDLESPRIKCRIVYKPYQAGTPVHKFLRIPYLDQYPSAPQLIQENRPWYQAWDRSEVLKVRGFSVYFSPKPPRQQHLKNIAVFALDSEDRPIPGKRITMPDQIAGGESCESMSLDPAFQRGDLLIEPGEYLSASCDLVDGTPTADCGIFVLVEIPEWKVPDAWGAPLFYSQGVANLEYLGELYDEDRIRHNSTFAATSILQSLATTEVSPWSEKFSVPEWPTELSEVENLYSRVSSDIFVD